MPAWVVAGTIDLLAYTDKENEVPFDWEESDPRYITNAADVKLRAFSTKVGWLRCNSRRHTACQASGGLAKGQQGAACFITAPAALHCPPRPTLTPPTLPLSGAQRGGVGILQGG